MKPRVSSKAQRPPNAKLPTLALMTLIAIAGPGIGNAQDPTGVIAGTAEADELTGTVGDDTINGRGGADLMIGLTGNDTYIVNDKDDEVVEQVAEGTDTIRAFVGFGQPGLPAYVENLVLEGNRSLDGTGNALANRIIGNSGDNRLIGGAGNDTLTSRAGHDIFPLGLTPLREDDVDRVTDFDVADDEIWLYFPAFPWIPCDGFSGKVLEPSRFYVGLSATAASHRIVYNPTSGVLFHDPDGTGPIAAVRFARLPAGLALTNANFYGVNRRSCP